MSEKYYFMHITSPNATRFELTIAKGVTNGWAKRLTLREILRYLWYFIYCFSIYRINCRISSGKNKAQNIFPFSEYFVKKNYRKRITDKISVVLNHNLCIAIVAVAYHCIFCLHNQHIQSIVPLSNNTNWT